MPRDDSKPLDFTPPKPWTWKDYRPTIEEILCVDKEALKKPSRSFYLESKIGTLFESLPCVVYSGTVYSQEFLAGLVPSLGTRL